MPATFRRTTALLENHYAGGLVGISSPGKPDSEAYECAYGRYTKEPTGVREKSSRS